MIIGINGYAGSGKDTVGKIIQWLIALKNCTNEDIKKRVALMGYNNYNYYALSGWEIRKFATKLKEIASILTGIPVENFEDQEFKNTELPYEWNYSKQVAESEDDGRGGVVDLYTTSVMKVRTFLQKLGTNAIRDNLHKNTWINALFADYKPIMKGWEIIQENGLESVDKIQQYPNWIITDVRFWNEATAIRFRGGIIIRVNRESLRFPHPSETDLDNWMFDEVIDNKGTVDELIEEVKKILIKREIL